MWLLTAALVAALSGVAYLLLGNDAARQMGQAVTTLKKPTASSSSDRMAHPLAKAERVETRQHVRPIAPAQMPADQGPKIQLPRPAQNVVP